MRVADMLVIARARESLGPEHALAHIVTGRRFKTIQIHARVGESLATWTMETLGLPLADTFASHTRLH